MTWIGLRDRHEGQFMPGGLRSPARSFADRSEDSVLACGSLQLECAFTPGHGATPLLHYDATDPWPSRLTLFFDASGVLTFSHRLGDANQWVRLETGLTAPVKGLIVTYCWDAPQRRGRLSLFDPETGRLWHTDMQGPMPLSLRDARRIATDRGLARIGADTEWVGLSEAVVPIGPMPGLDGAARIALPGGQAQRIDQIETGQIVQTVDGDRAQVRWVGSAEVIARGRFAPVRLRAPFHDLGRDIIVSPDQRLHLAGSDVEYLFGVEEVSAAAGHLLDQRSVLPAQSTPTQRYWQVLLDRPAAILVEGCAVESFDCGPVCQDPAMLRLTVLVDLPAELLPCSTRSPVPVLQGYEAMTLAYSGVA